MKTIKKNICRSLSLSRPNFFCFSEQDNNKGPAESIYDLPVAQKYVVGNIK